MSARIVILTNPLDPSRRRALEIRIGEPLLAWIDEHAPAPGRAQRAVFVNGLRVDDAAYLVQPDDEILVTFVPGTLAAIGAYIAQALVAAAIGYVLSRLFMPGRPKAANTPSPSQVYGIARPTNAARLGQPIPVVYGTVITLPDFAAQPYVEFVNNDQFFKAILCVGQGEHDVLELLLGDSSAAGLGSDVATWRVWQPSDHASTFGTIQSVTGVRENCVTSSNVADQELLAPNVDAPLVPSTWYWFASSVVTSTTPQPGYIDLSHATTLDAKLALLPSNPALGTQVNTSYGQNGSVWTFVTYTAAAYDRNVPVTAYSLVPPPNTGAGVAAWIGPFDTCKPGQVGTTIELDFVFPGGLYTMDGGGNLLTWTITVQVETTPINDAGTVIGAPVVTVQTFTAANNTPQRYTRSWAVAAGRYRVRCARQTNSDGKANTIDACTWSGLKFVLVAPPAGTKVYGNVTLIAMTLKATNGVSSSAANSIRFRVTRRLAPLGTGTPVATVNPADVFVDVVCAAYGGNRPRNVDELDLDELAASRTLWAGAPGFNAVFDQPSTVWEALSLSVQTVNAAPLPVGSRMTLIHDGPQAVPSQIFMDGNIATSSLTVTETFDQEGTPAGVRIEYRDPRTFTEAALLQPIDAPDYTTVSLFGCTDQTVAQQHATLVLNKRRLQRTQLQFTTELEGLSCLPGDRIGVQSAMMGWAQSARVVAVDGLEVTLDRARDWSAGGPWAANLRDTEGVPHRVTGVTRGGADDALVLPAAPAFTLQGYGGALEPTLVAFGVDGADITDWTVTKMQPQGQTVVINATNYVPGLWAGAASYQQLEEA